MELVLSNQTVTVNGKTIPKIYGGFGNRQPSILAKQIADLHDCKLKEIHQILHNNLDWFDEGIDFIDLKSVVVQDDYGIKELLLNFYTQEGLNRSNCIYIFSQQGYAMLCKLLKSDLAKQIYKQMVRDYFRMTENKQRLNSALPNDGSEQQTLTRIFEEQRLFQQYAIQGFERIEAVLSESKLHDMFESWKRVKKLVDDMTQMYDLSDKEQRQYVRELCQINEIHLPEKVLLEKEPLFHDAQKIAIKTGLYSVNDKPHSILIGALVRYLRLESSQYCQKLTIIRHGYKTTVVQYSDNVIPHIMKWLQENNYPTSIVLTPEAGKIRKFQAKYRHHARKNN